MSSETVFLAGADLGLASAALLEAAHYPPCLQGVVADILQKDLHGAQDRMKEVSMNPEYMVGYLQGVMLTLALVMMFMALLLAMNGGGGPNHPVPVMCPLRLRVATDVPEQYFTIRPSTATHTRPDAKGQWAARFRRWVELAFRWLTPWIGREAIKLLRAAFQAVE